MSEIVEEMPKVGVSGPRGGRPPKYPWDLWLDGRVHRLVQSVPTGEVVEREGELVPVMTEGDFENGVEQMRKYVRNAVSRRRSKLKLRTRVETVLVEGRKVGILYVQASAGEVGGGVPLPGVLVGVPGGGGEAAVVDGGGDAIVGVPDARPVDDAGEVVDVAAVAAPVVDGVVTQAALEAELAAAGQYAEIMTQGDPGVVDRPHEFAVAEVVVDGEVQIVRLGEEEEDDADEGDWKQIDPSEDEEDPYARLSEEEIAAEMVELGL